jgi:hypothetical protein
MDTERLAEAELPTEREGVGVDVVLGVAEGGGGEAERETEEEDEGSTTSSQHSSRRHGKLEQSTVDGSGFSVKMPRGHWKEPQCVEVWAGQGGIAQLNAWVNTAPTPRLLGQA